MISLSVAPRSISRISNGSNGFMSLTLELTYQSSRNHTTHRAITTRFSAEEGGPGQEE